MKTKKLTWMLIKMPLSWLAATPWHLLLRNTKAWLECKTSSSSKSSLNWRRTLMSSKFWSKRTNNCRRIWRWSRGSTLSWSRRQEITLTCWTLKPEERAVAAWTSNLPTRNWKRRRSECICWQKKTKFCSSKSPYWEPITTSTQTTARTRCRKRKSRSTGLTPWKQNWRIRQENGMSWWKLTRLLNWNWPKRLNFSHSWKMAGAPIKLSFARCESSCRCSRKNINSIRDWARS